MAADSLVADLRPVTLSEFSDLMAECFGDLPEQSADFAVGVSGGPDSMALCFLLRMWARRQRNPPSIHVLTVDHGLRKESAQEAKQVGRWLKDFKEVRHKILTWRPDTAVTSRVQEQAREARYALMGSFMKEQGLKRLFVAHHLDDQAETVLFRLTRGSGLDGLSGMAPEQPFAEGLVLCRPLLSIPKARLVRTCKANAVDYLDDPSNQSDQFTRVRLRGSMHVLEGEGLTPERLGLTAKRLARAREALDALAEKMFIRGLLDNKTGRIVFSIQILRDVPEEIGLRVLLRMIAALVPPEPYGPRLERVEALFCDLLKPAPFRKRTLHGIVFERKDREGHLSLTLEGGNGGVKAKKGKK